MRNHGTNSKAEDDAEAVNDNNQNNSIVETNFNVVESQHGLTSKPVHHSNKPYKRGFFRRYWICLFLLFILLGTIVAAVVVIIVKKHKRPPPPPPPIIEVEIPLEQKCFNSRRQFNQMVDSLSGARLQETPHRFGKWFIKDNDVPIDVPVFTYQDRYSAYLDPNFNTTYLNYTQFAECNRLQNLPRRTALKIQIHESKNFTEDFIVFMRSLIIEFSWKLNTDVYILYNVASLETYDRDRIPGEFKGILEPFTLGDIQGVIHNTTDVYKVIWNIIPDLTHLIDIWFAQKYPNYEHYWSIEDDVRSTAPWDIFIDHVFQSFKGGEEGEEKHLIVFTPVWACYGDHEWNITAFPEENRRKTWIQLRRYSKALVDAMEYETSIGHYAMVEYFYPSTASLYNLTIYVYLPTIYGLANTLWTNETTLSNCTVTDIYGGTWPCHPGARYGNIKPNDNGTFYFFGNYHCCQREGMDSYIEWKNTSGDYRPMTIIHPVKI
jgi:hypothetical protein